MALDKDICLKVTQAVNEVGAGRLFAIGDACVAAIHYKDFYEGMEDFDFAALREDYDELAGPLTEAASRLGLETDGEVMVSGIAYPKPYMRIGKGDTWCRIYPLDSIPEQVTLRFLLFREAKDVMTRFEEAQAKQSWDTMPAICQAVEDLKRYNGLEVNFCARLLGAAGGGHMGERTIFTRSIEKANLFPLRTMEFAGVTIPVAQTVSNWTAEMTPQRMEIIKTIQREGVESLAEIDRVCKELGINYFMCGGSMLGSLRHGGFIPWDDDMDIGMLRKDYKRFMKEAPALLDKRYFIQLPGTDKHNHFVYARLRKSGIEYITYYNEDKDFHKGLWIDIFPFDAHPKNGALQRIQRKCANMLARASMGFKRRKEYVEHDVALTAPIACEEDEKYLRSYLRKSKLFPVALTRGGYHFAARILNPFLMARPGALHASYIPGYTTITTEELLPVRYVPYETGEFPIPNKAEAFLERQYGDWMALPPVHERYAEHGFKYLLLPDGTKMRP